MEYQETIKAAAKRMCEQLESKGVPVKHTQMLEAIATGFGLDSWRELKAVIDAPRAPETPKCPPLGEMQEWTVDALYTDNNQQYGDSTTARVPLEAAYNVIVERRTDFGNEVCVLDVSDMAGVSHLSPSFISEVQGRCVHTTFVKLFEAASKVPTPTDDAKLALTWLGLVLKTYEEDNSLEELLEWNKLESLSGYGKSHTPAPIVEGSTLLPSRALNLLCTAVESHIGLLTLVETDDELAGCIFQIEAMCGYFEAVLDDEDVSLIVHSAFD